MDNFYALTPEAVMRGVESAGFEPTGRYIQLNSYENRVFDVFLEPKNSEPEPHVIVKFYRPGRWSHSAILEEHSFLFELAAAGIPVGVPLMLKVGSTVAESGGLYLSVSSKIRGRMPDELNLEDLASVGRMLARLHNVGEQKRASHRPTLTSEAFGRAALKITKNWAAPELWPRYERAALEICDFLEEELDPQSYLRIHGDCHRGNLLFTDRPNEARTYFLVDFDDFCNGPPAQDFWMLFSSDESGNSEEQEALISGYDELRRFPYGEERLFAPLRGLRIIHYAAWIARRWTDPSFPQLFPQFKDYNTWAEETERLERIAWAL